jgi:hypothetical protein
MKILSQKTLVRILVLSLALVLTNFSSSNAASTKKLRVNGQIEISLPTAFKISKSGCVGMPFKFKLNRGFDSDSLITMYVEDDIYRYVAYKSWSGYELREKANSKTLQGTEKIEFCRDLRYDEPSDQDLYPSYKGNHMITLVFDGSDYRELTSPIKLSE